MQFEDMHLNRLHAFVRGRRGPQQAQMPMNVACTRSCNCMQATQAATTQPPCLRNHFVPRIVHLPSLTHERRLLQPVWCTLALRGVEVLGAALKQRFISLQWAGWEGGLEAARLPLILHQQVMAEGRHRRACNKSPSCSFLHPPSCLRNKSRPARPTHPGAEGKRHTGGSMGAGMKPKQMRALEGELRPSISRAEGIPPYRSAAAASILLQ